MATYDEIIAYAPLAAFLQNRDTVAEMPGIVRRAQTYLTRRMDHDFFRQDVPQASADAAGVVTHSIPEEDLLEIRSVSILLGGGRQLPIHPRDYPMLVSLYHDRPRGTPQHWAYNPAGKIQVFPAPGRVIPVILSANIREPILSPAVQENRISTRYPELMEQAVAMHVALFNLDPATTQLYSTQVQDMLITVNAEISRQRRDETSQRPTETRNVAGT